MRDGSLNEYKKLYESMEILNKWQSRVSRAADRVLSGKTTYLNVARETTVPWWVIGIIHLLECDCDWTGCLHNGEPWNRETTMVPKGRGPWQSWTEAAIDAIRYDGLNSVSDWSIAEGLRRLEMYNGGGYKRRGVNSPYIWSGTNHGIGVGKYKEIMQPNGSYKSVYDPNLVSQQCGCAPVLKVLLEKSKDQAFAIVTDTKSQIVNSATRLNELIHQEQLNLEAFKAEVKSLVSIANTF